MSDALVVRGLAKRLGRTEALRGLDLTVPRGSIFGLVGENGAGKTTTFSIVCGFLRPDAGAIDLLGEGPFDWRRHRGRVTAMPQDALLGGQLRCREQLLHLGRLQGLHHAEAARATDRALDAVALADRADEPAHALSHGMRRRLAVAQALLGAPELVILDEPTNGLDPRHAFELRELLRARRGSSTLLISSHNLAELESLCDHVAFIARGRCEGGGSIERLTGRSEEVEIELAAGPVPLAALQSALAGDAVAWDDARRTLSIRITRRPGDARELEDAIGIALRALLDNGARIAGVRRGSTLEKRFLARG